MVAIDRLREVATRVEDGGCVSPGGECRRGGGLTCRSCLADELYGIADQMEREQNKVAMTDWEAVREVYDDMARHVSGIPEFDDLVDRWCRTLDDALDGRAGSVHDTAEDRKAIAWVREHGGMSHVKDIYHDLRAVVERLGVEWSESELHGLMDVLDRRLMPEGIEWPMFEDGEPVRFGEEAMGFSHKPPFVVDHVTLFDGGEVTVCAEVDLDSGSVENFVRVLPGERVKRPAPKVLDADGEEIRVGDTVWTTRDLDKFTVTNPNNGKFLSVSCKDKGGDDYCCYPTDLTHQRPVLDADGVPIKNGDTVYLLPGEWCDEFPCLGFYGGEELEVFADGEAPHVSGSVQCCEKEAKDGLHGICYPQPSQLTHTKPELHKRCRDCAHWQKDPTADKIGVCWFFYHEHEGQDCYPARLGDIGACEEFMPRARALAERERSE